MQQEKPKSIQTVGSIVIVIAAIMTFSNMMGGFAFTMLGIIDAGEGPAETGADNLFLHFGLISLTGVLLGILFLVGGIYLRKYKKWANRLITVASILLLLLMWSLIILFSNSFKGEEHMNVMIGIGAFVMVVFTAPLLLLIGFLNKKKTLVHFV